MNQKSETRFPRDGCGECANRICIIVHNRISLISCNSLRSQLSFDVLCFKMDNIVLEISTKI